MSADDRYELFGGPTETLAAAAVFGYREEHGCWPLWEDAVEYRAVSPDHPCDLEEADRLIREAVAADEVAPVFVGRRGQIDLLLKLSDDMAARMKRRYMDATMGRQEDD